jgi:hypothetical protein
MRKIAITLIINSIITLSVCYGQLMTPLEKGFQAITSDAIKAQLGFLASDWTEGRMAGEKGEMLSSDYIASMLQLYGVKPGGDKFQSGSVAKNAMGNERSYFQNFELLKTVAGEEQILRVKSTDGRMQNTTDFIYNIDFTLRPSEPCIEIEAPVVFAGYGFKNDKIKYNDLEKLDIKGKFILKISGIPDFAKESLTKNEIDASVSATESELRTMGVAGIIEFNPNAALSGSTERKEFMNMSPSENNPRYGRPSASYSIPSKKSTDSFIRLTVSAKTADEILKGSGINLDDYIKKGADSKPYIYLPVNEKKIYLRTSVKTTRIAVRNVIGIIEGNNPDQIIVLGAHYDHMGTWNGYLWNGADDNASGTVGVMTLAKAIMETGKKPEKTIVIALWTAEEEGLLGSRYYVQNLPYPLKDLKLNVNFDMISRYITENDPSKVTMTYTSSYPVFKEITTTFVKKFNLDLSVDYQPSDDPPGGTDHRSFVAVGVPVIRFKPGHREEYHTPQDEVGTVDWDIMEKIIKISFADVWELANTKW